MLTYARASKKCGSKSDAAITPTKSGTTFLFLGPNGLGLDSIDALELGVSMKDLWRGGGPLRGGREGPPDR